MSTVLVFGASGNIGAATIKALKDKFPAVKVVAAVRDPSKGKVPEGVTVVKGDQGDYHAAHAAIKSSGADAVFVIPPGSPNRTEVGVVAIRAAADANVKLVLLLSVSNVDHPNTVFGKQFIPLENAARHSGVPFSVIRLPLFFDNNYGNVGSIQGQGAFYSPLRPDAPYSNVSVADAGEAAANILAHPSDHAGKVYDITSHATTEAELAAAFSKALGKDVKHVQVPYEAAESAMLGLGFPKWQVDGIIELHHAINDGEYVYPSHFKAVTGREPVTSADWVNAHAAAFKSS